MQQVQTFPVIEGGTVTNLDSLDEDVVHFGVLNDGLVGSALHGGQRSPSWDGLLHLFHLHLICDLFVPATIPKTTACKR